MIIDITVPEAGKAEGGKKTRRQKDDER